jgi:hypothetical protein
MFRRNGDCTFYVAVKIGGDPKKMLGLGAISFDKAFRRCPFFEKYFFEKFEKFKSVNRKKIYYKICTF